MSSFMSRVRARRTDPSTSHAAAASVSGLRERQLAVLSVFQKHGPLTDEELVNLYGDRDPKQAESGLRTRRKELVDLGFVMDTGRRGLTKNNRQTIIWTAC